jgi:hypothetical protein
MMCTSFDIFDKEMHYGQPCAQTLFQPVSK